MKRKTILYIAMTLDGYIADEKDQISFLDDYHDIKFANQTYEDLLKQIDTLIMGRKTYDTLLKLVKEWPYPNLKTYVFTTSDTKQTDSVLFVKGEIKSFMDKLISSNGKDIWIVGGGIVVQTLLNLDLIDEFHITIIPKLLGKGKLLFHQLNQSLDLKLIETKVEDNLVMLIYKRKQ